jgi:DNA-binding GntR family transcriptional regulator
VKVERIERDPRGLTSEVRDKIIGAMMAGELVPGDRLILDTLADQFGVSRTPVRDALLRLVSEGIVELADKRGYVFRQLSDAEIEHNLESRIAIESYAAEILAKKGETGIRSARAALDEVHRTPRTSVRAFFEANMHVHRAIVAGTENPSFSASSTQSGVKRPPIRSTTSTTSRLPMRRSTKITSASSTRSRSANPTPRAPPW